MPPKHGFTNPAPKTSSAREALSSFYCNLCAKGYARMNLYEAHLSSYDHSHKQRLKDMRQLSKDPMAGERARKAEAKANAGSGLISIKIGDGGGSGVKKGGFKKAGFKSAFGGEAMVDEDVEVKNDEKKKSEVVGKIEENEGGEEESDTEDEGYVMYDPRYPTD